MSAWMSGCLGGTGIVTSWILGTVVCIIGGLLVLSTTGLWVGTYSVVVFSVPKMRKQRNGHVIVKKLNVSEILHVL